VGEKYTVYLDIVFTINFFMDFVLLWATAKFSQLRTSWVRLAAGALVGACYSLALLLPALHFLLSFSIKVLFSIAMVYVAFPRLNLKRFVQALGYFYLVAFTMGGAMLGAIYLISKEQDLYGIINGIFVFLTNVKYTWLVAAVAAAFVLVRYGVGFLKRNFLHSFFKVPVIVRIGEKSISTQALVDTGNQLKDPLTLKPVMIVEFDVLKKILPPEMAAALGEQSEPDLDRIVNSLSGSPWASRIRLVPFTSIGKYKGMLVGIRPDEVVVITADNNVRIKDIIVGVYHRPLSQEGAYRALLHPDVLNPTMLGL
jgi:stage II sporulation protein GA (sporulation sigma-E factor processing peptidase)